MLQEMARRYPNILEVASVARHDDGSVVSYGCDDQFEFEFALDLMLDGFERLHGRDWSSARGEAGAPVMTTDVSCGWSQPQETSAVGFCTCET